MRNSPDKSTVKECDRALTDRLMGLPFRESLPAVAASYDELVATARLEERERCAKIVHNLNGGRDLREIEEAILAE